MPRFFLNRSGLVNNCRGGYPEISRWIAILPGGTEERILEAMQFAVQQEEFATEIRIVGELTEAQAPQLIVKLRDLSNGKIQVKEI